MKIQALVTKEIKVPKARKYRSGFLSVLQNYAEIAFKNSGERSNDYSSASVPQDAKRRRHDDGNQTSTKTTANISVEQKSEIRTVVKKIRVEPVE
ncbi:hypothetical protein [Rhizobium leguminosarum]|uniref:hypothetical protein n=1 Tax=Rhizobium leguminosarum TaxID=384 RepID=UPI003F991BC8